MKLLSNNLEIGTFIKEQLEEILPVYPIIADKGAEGNFGLYRRTAFISKNTKDIFNYEETISMEIYICSQTYKESVSLAQKVKDKLESFKGIFKNTFITNIYLENANEDFNNDVYLQRLYFIIDIDNGKIKRR